MLMQLDTVLEVDCMSKLYSREQISTRQRLATTFTRALMGRRPSRPPKKLKSGEFWSLEDISFTLKRGEALGVIGLNGAGKTTLLRTLAGQLLPDKGEIRILGDAVAMIDLTAGFQMSASGSRNIHLRGAMLGRSKEDIKETYDEILDFAELGDAINAPVSTYSSGMLMRLAFSIMVMAKPDVLLIDEILSVGDFTFRQKCLSRIREMREHAAIILVSHSMEQIKLFCNHVILLNKGRVAFKGDPEEAISTYEKMKNKSPISKEEAQAQVLAPQFNNAELIKQIEHFWCNKDGQHITQIHTGETLYLKVSFIVKYKVQRLIIGVPVWTEDRVYVTGFSTELQEKTFQVIPNKRMEFILKVPNLNFNPGSYISNCGITDGLEFLYRGSNSTLVVTSEKKRYWGIVSLPHYWNATNKGEAS